MIIDIISSAPSCGVCPTEPAGASPETPADGPGSFAALLGEAAGEPGEPVPVDQDDGAAVPEEEWAVFGVPVPVPVLEPVVPIEMPSWSDAPAESVETEVGVESPIEVPASVSGVPGLPVTADAPAVEEGRDEVSPVKGQSQRAEPAVRPEDSAADATSRSKATTAPGPAIAASTEASVVSAGLPGAAIVAESGDADVAVSAAPADVRPAGEVAERPDRAVGHAAVAAAAAVERNRVSAPQANGETVSPIPEPPGTEAGPLPPAATASHEVASPEAVERIKGVAARLARALERSADPVAAPVADTADAQTGEESGQDGQPQPSPGEWLRDQIAPRAAGTQPGSVNPTFALTAPAPHDARSAVLGGASIDPAPSGAPVLPSEREIASQLIHSLRVQFRDGIGEAMLKLKPEHLGSLSISLRVENGGLKASVQAEMPQVRQWLESQRDSLRSALAEHGLRLDRFVVDPDGQRQNASRDAREESSPRRRRPRRSVQGDQPAFEVVV